MNNTGFDKYMFEDHNAASQVFKTPLGKVTVAV